MPPHFVCSICGEEHDGLVTDWAYSLPDEVWAIPEPERSEQAHYDNDLCQFGDRFFIRCVLPVPFREAEGAYCWGAWAEAPRPTFDRYLELYDKDAGAEPMHAGTLANALPAYPGSVGTPVRIQFGDQTKRPTLHLREDDDCQLGREQRGGIDNARYHEILDVISGRKPIGR